MKVSQNNQDLLFKAAIVTGVYFAFGRPILKFLGIAKSQAEKDLENMAADPGSAFNDQLYKKYLYFYGDQAKGRKLISAALGEKIQNAALNIFDGMGIFTDSEDIIISSIKQFSTKAQISLLAAWFKTKYNLDLVLYLKDGKGIMPQNGLNSSELAAIVNWVRNLPIK